MYDMILHYTIDIQKREDANRCSSYVELVVPNYTFNEFRQHFRLTRSVVLQGICKHQRKFTDVLCGCACSTHDATVMRSSPIYAEICHNKPIYFPDEIYTIGDQAYPLESWLICRPS
jgi:hypothetical protein